MDRDEKRKFGMPLEIKIYWVGQIFGLKTKPIKICCKVLSFKISLQSLKTNHRIKLAFLICQLVTANVCVLHSKKDLIKQAFYCQLGEETKELPFFIHQSKRKKIIGVSIL